MKSQLSLLAISLFLVGALLSSCTKDKCVETVTYEGDVPVYMSYDLFRSSIVTEPARDLKDPGKIYFKDNFLFISETNEGIHVIDNNDPNSPRMVSFIKVLGNVDIAVKGNILYADSHTDLVALDISDPNNVKEIARMEHAFPYTTDRYYFDLDTTQGVVVDWRKDIITVEQECDPTRRHQGNDFVTFGVAGNSGTSGDLFSSNSGGGETAGKGGSMAGFSLVDKYLYTIDNTSLHLINIEDPKNIHKENRVWIGVNIETLFPYGDRLFIGSQTGMHIYDNSDPSNPIFISEYEHVQACDPVVVRGDYAYVTLSSGNECWTP
ncbi:MAG: hypothetical protein IH946_12335, partial [Bacteroidetes bacterium]|nr:hypothetical protein [Bacteroidota bacterium]